MYDKKYCVSFYSYGRYAEQVVNLTKREAMRIAHSYDYAKFTTCEVWKYTEPEKVLYTSKDGYIFQAEHSLYW